MATYPTTRIIINLADPTGRALSGAVVIATISAPDLWSGVVVQKTTRAHTNSAGAAEMALFPNSTGSRRTTYRFDIQHPEIAPAKFAGVVVPEVASITLVELLGGILPPESGVPNGALVLPRGALVLPRGVLILTA